MCTYMPSYTVRIFVIYVDECYEEMGMRNGRILDSMIKASTYRDKKHSPQRARLGSTGSWLATTDDKNQFIQV